MSEGPPHPNVRKFFDDPEQTEARIAALTDKVIDVCNAEKTHHLIAMNALMRVACFIAVDAGSTTEDLLAGVRATYEQVLKAKAS
jgi:hypothetical protein